MYSDKRYGRCGSAIHQCLKNWGCTIVVYDRDENACERAKEAGAKICEYKDLSKVLKKAAFLFIVQRRLLCGQRSDCWKGRPMPKKLGMYDRGV